MQESMETPNERRNGRPGYQTPTARLIPLLVIFFILFSYYKITSIIRIVCGRSLLQLLSRSHFIASTSTSNRWLRVLRQCGAAGALFSPSTARCWTRAPRRLRLTLASQSPISRTAVRLRPNSSAPASIRFARRFFVFVFFFFERQVRADRQLRKPPPAHLARCERFACAFSVLSPAPSARFEFCASRRSTNSVCHP